MENLKTMLEHADFYAHELKKLDKIAEMMSHPVMVRDLIKLVFGENGSRKVDSAYPCQYANKIREIYPNFNEGNHCYSYVENSYGEMVNLNDKFTKWVFEKESVMEKVNKRRTLKTLETV